MPFETETRHNRPPRSRFKAYLTLLPILILTLAVSHRTRSQTTAPTAPTTPAIPPRIVYKQVFQHLVFLDYQANVADQHGQNGNLYRNYYQTHASLTPAEATLLKSTAHDAVIAVAAVDKQIQAEVAIYRSQFPGGKRPKGKPWPPLPPQLHTLQVAKDNVIFSHIATLQTGFGASRFQNLDTFVQAEIAPHITLTTAPKASAGSTTTSSSAPPPLQAQPAPWLP
jgi:hypothetical protein